MNTNPGEGIVTGVIRFFVENKPLVHLFVLGLIVAGLVVAPFDRSLPGLPRHPVAVDAIPDVGENQQIVFVEWPGRSPQDVEDQVTYPLTTALLGVPKVKAVRAVSMLGFASIFVIFDEKADFYWCRSRVLEKLAGLPPGALPEGVQPSLGPDATPLGQVFWYTLEGRTPDGRPAGGWRLDELRSIQDWQVRYALQSVEGVSEVASVGGYVREYQVDADPDAMRVYRVTLTELLDAVRKSNLDISAGVMEINRVEYAIRGVGFVKSPREIEDSVIKVVDDVPIYVRQVARVQIGPAERRGVLDKGGAEAVGGVVVVRYGANPMAVIRDVKTKIEEIAPALPEKTLPDGTRSRVTIVPFYDRTGLIHETLDTLRTAIYLQVLVTTTVILVMVRHLAGSALISCIMPLAVLFSFVAMKAVGVQANIVSLSGIAIAIGTIVDMGIILSENIRVALRESPPRERPAGIVIRAASEVGPAILTAMATTVVGFLPVFAMEGAEGKLFKPLAFTKTFTLITSLVIALTILPSYAQMLFSQPPRRSVRRFGGPAALLALGLWLSLRLTLWGGALLMVAGGILLLEHTRHPRIRGWAERVRSWPLVLSVGILLALYWSPLGADRGLGRNLAVVGVPIGALLLCYAVFARHYDALLKWCLDHRRWFLLVPVGIVLWGLLAWLGAPRLLGWLPPSVRMNRWISGLWHAFPGLGKEFMPPLDEGSFLYMPTLMPHASIAESLDVLQQLDARFSAIPEVEHVVGKIGRAESALDPAPISMIETLITYKPRHLTDAHGRRLAFRFLPDVADFVRDPAGRKLHAPDGKPYLVRGKFARDAEGRLIPDRRGRPFPLWRPPLDPSLNPGRKAWGGIRTPDDIWMEILRLGEMPGVTSAPRLQPIAARTVMLQSGMRAPMGLKVYGPDLASIEQAAVQLEAALRKAPGIAPQSVIADRMVGKPYLEIIPDRAALARYGIAMETFQHIVETAVGGQRATMTVEHRERYAIRVRYLRELRDSIEALEGILIPSTPEKQIPLRQVAAIRYTRGPEMIKSENGSLVGYVLFDRQASVAEVDAVEQARAWLADLQRSGALVLPPGVRYAFAGNYENQLRAQRRLSLIIPAALGLILILLYLQFRSSIVSLYVFAGIFVAWAGGFIVLWLYAQPWWLNIDVFGSNLRDLFLIRPVHLSVAIWVGFLALFGIASDDGVVICTYLQQEFRRARIDDIKDIRMLVRKAAQRRLWPCLMTTATTVLALLPVLSSTGRGADIMVPMAIPVFGGMVVEVITMLVAPVLYAAHQERAFRRRPSATSSFAGVLQDSMAAPIE